MFIFKVNFVVVFYYCVSFGRKTLTILFYFKESCYDCVIFFLHFHTFLFSFDSPCLFLNLRKIMKKLLYFQKNKKTTNLKFIVIIIIVIIIFIIITVFLLSFSTSIKLIFLFQSLEKRHEKHGQYQYHRTSLVEMLFLFRGFVHALPALPEQQR